MALRFHGLKLSNRQCRQGFLLCFQDAGIAAAMADGRGGVKMQPGSLCKQNPRFQPQVQTINFLANETDDFMIRFF